MKKLLQGGALLVFAGLLAGCASSGAQSGFDSAVSQHSSGGADYAATEYESLDEFGMDEFAPAELERQIIITGNLYAKSDDPFKSADGILKLISDSGGFVEDRSQSGKVKDGTASVMLTARIPADKTPEAIEEIENTIEVYEISTNKQDVTDQVLDVEARIAALETSVERLTTLMAEATTSEALFEAEDALTRRQAELDSLRAVQRGLKDQVSLATLTIHIDSEEVFTSPPDGFMGGLTAGWKALVATFLSLVTALGAIVPWLIVIIPLGFVVIWLLRRAKRSRTNKHEPVAKVEPEATE
ncbi:MAG TPA: DUF4349 domain-containing protein [Actinomycetales bacterium]|nr:DUF4349 domain-containing protein [Actinomycetales bacterium]